MIRSPVYRPTSILTLRKSTFDIENLLLLLLPVLSAVSFNVIGQLLASDLLVVATFLVMLARGKLRLSQPGLRALLLMWLIWACGAVLSDLVNASSARNIARGWAKLGLFALYLIVIFNLIDGKPRRMRFALIGLGLGMMLLDADTLSLDPDDDALRTRWKMGFGFGLALWIGLFVQGVTQSRRNTALIVFLLNPLNLVLGARSLFLTLFLSSLLTLAARRIRNRRQRAKIGVVALIFLVGGTIFGQGFYDTAVRTGLFGQATLEKHLFQTQNGAGILLNGRPESLVSLRAIADKPLLGHGSWAENRAYRALYYQLQEEAGLRPRWQRPAPDDNDLIPSHSMLLGAWVEHGLAGAIFWIFVLGLALRALIQGTLGPHPAPVVAQMLLIALIWDLLFSPFGAARRCTEVIFIACAGMVLNANAVEPSHRRGRDHAAYGTPSAALRAFPRRFPVSDHLGVFSHTPRRKAPDNENLGRHQCLQSGPVSAPLP